MQLQAIKMGVVLFKWARPKFFVQISHALVLQPHHSKILDPPLHTLCLCVYLDK